MSEIVLAIGLWVTVVIQAVDPYNSRKKALLGALIVFSIGYSVFAFMQIGDPRFAQLKSFNLYMAVWFPLFTWAYNTRAQAVVAQHGESSLGRRYGAPKLRLDELDDQRLARKVKLSHRSMWGVIALFLVERTFTYVQIAT
jgi:hypothetical protein